MKNQKSKQFVEIWLRQEDKMDPQVQASLKALFVQYQAEGITPVVYYSGCEDLYQNTVDHLLYTRKRIAELQVQQEKKQHQEHSLEA